MSKLAKKLRTRAGESFAEVLIALLIIALAALLLAGMYSSSAALDKAAMDDDKELYEALTRLETGEGATETPTTVSVGDETHTVNMDVNIYTEDGLSAYKKR